MSESKPQLRTWKDWLRIYLSGVCFGFADLMPGISSGTVAFILGIYEKLLSSIRSVNGKAIAALLRGQFQLFFATVAWQFFLALALGVSTTMILMSGVIAHILNQPVPRSYLFSLFFGLVLGAAYFCSKQIHFWRAWYAALLLGAIGITLMLTFPRIATVSTDSTFEVFLAQSQLPVAAQDIPLANYRAETQQLTGVNASTLSAMLARGVVKADTTVYSVDAKASGRADSFVTSKSDRGLSGWLFVCGMLGAGAMLLPGVSGSYMLTILGAYSIAIIALADFIGGIGRLSFDWDAFLVLVSLFLGVLVGAALMSRVVSRLLHSYHDQTIVVLTGFMLGALPAVWPFRSYDYLLLPLRLDKPPQLHVTGSILPDFLSAQFAVALGCTLVGICLVLGLERVRRHD